MLKIFKKQKTTLENLGSGDQTLVTDSDISALPKAVQEDSRMQMSCSIPMKDHRQIS